MLTRIKLALRYNNTIFDDEIEGYIVACKNNLVLGGVNENRLDETDESYINTTIAYCKWLLNYQGDGDKWKGIYDSLKLSIILDSNYK